MKLDQQAIADAVEKLTVPQARQLLARLDDRYKDLYFEVPVGVREFIESPDYLNRKGEIWPSIVEELEQIFRPSEEDPEAFQYGEAVLLMGIGSGKSFETGISAAYLTYRMLCFKSPHKRFALALNTEMDYLIVAPNATKAGIVFNYVSNLVSSSPWFQTYYPPDPNISSELRFDHQPVDDHGKPVPSAIGKPYKNVIIMPGNSSQSSPLGHSLFGAAIDEANFWETYESIKNGKNERLDSMYLALQRRIESRFGNWGLLSMISSSQHDDDFTELKILEADTEDGKHIYAARKAIWERKPKGTYSAKVFNVETRLHGVMIDIQVPIDLKRHFNKNRMAALRDFASIPAGAENNYLDPEKVQYVAEHFALISPVKECDDMGYILEWADHMDRPVPYLCSIGVDLSKSRDSCGIALGYWNPETNRLVVPFLWEIKCSKERPLDYAAVREVITTLRDKGWLIHLATFDNFQSADTMQQLERAGITCEKISVDANTAAYDTLSDYLGDKAMMWYPHPTAVKELKKVVLIAGKKVDHPKGGSKDVADALAHVAFIVGRDLRSMTSVGVNPGSAHDVPSPSSGRGGTGGRDEGSW